MSFTTYQVITPTELAHIEAVLNQWMLEADHRAGAPALLASPVTDEEFEDHLDRTEEARP